MKVLNISLERKLFSSGSKAVKRVLEYCKLFDRFDLIIPTGRGYAGTEIENMKIVPTDSISKFFYIFDAYRIGKNMMKKRKYDVITAQDPFETGIIAFLLAKKFKTKLQIQLHGDYFGSVFWRKENILNRIRYCLGKYIIKKADAIRAVSKRVEKSLIDMSIMPEKIVTIPIYTPTENTTPNQKKNGKFIFLTVGRLAPEKNMEIQIEAMKEIIKENRDVELWIVGEGPEKKKLEAKIKKFRLEGMVKFFGWQENMAEYYHQASAFLLTSNYEGWGLAVIEAAGFGLPIIMTDVGCAGEVIKNRQNGIVIKIGDKKSLTAAMLELLQNPDLRVKIGDEAKKAALSLPGREQNFHSFKKSFDILFK